jgi:hypothetical protein
LENTEENIEKIGKVLKKGKLNSEMIWKIWKKINMSPRIFYIFTRNKIILIIFFFLKKIHRFIEEMFHIVIKIFVCSIW